MEFLTDAHPLVYIVVIAIATMLFLPGSISMMIAGFTYGFLPGFLWAAIAIPLGAQLAFEAGRWVARPWVERRLQQNERMRAIQAALVNEAFLIILLTRLSLPIPYNLLNYLYGATPVRASVYFIATAIGMLPAIGLYVYLGSIARDIGEIMSDEATPSELGYWLLAFGTAAIVAVVIIIHRTAARALQKHLEEGVESSV